MQGAVVDPGGDAAVIRVRGTNKAIAVKTDCNGRYVYLDPRVGGRIAVAEAARPVVAAPARQPCPADRLDLAAAAQPQPPAKIER